MGPAGQLEPVGEAVPRERHRGLAGERVDVLGVDRRRAASYARSARVEKRPDRRSHARAGSRRRRARRRRAASAGSPAAAARRRDDRLWSVSAPGLESIGAGHPEPRSEPTARLSDRSAGRDQRGEGDQRQRRCGVTRSGLSGAWQVICAWVSLSMTRRRGERPGRALPCQSPSGSASRRDRRVGRLDELPRVRVEARLRVREVRELAPGTPTLSWSTPSPSGTALPTRIPATTWRSMSTTSSVGRRPFGNPALSPPMTPKRSGHRRRRHAEVELQGVDRRAGELARVLVQARDPLEHRLDDVRAVRLRRVDVEQRVQHRRQLRLERRTVRTARRRGRASSG